MEQRCWGNEMQEGSQKATVFHRANVLALPGLALLCLECETVLKMLIVATLRVKPIVVFVAIHKFGERRIESSHDGNAAVSLNDHLTQIITFEWIFFSISLSLLRLEIVAPSWVLIGSP
jgi:hypothetical protein